MTDPAHQLAQLRETVRLLTLENDRLTEQVSETLLLGSLAEDIESQSDPDQVIRVGLERVALLKDLPLCSYWQLESNLASLLAVYSSQPCDLEPGHPLQIPGALRRALADGPRLLVRSQPIGNDLLAQLTTDDCQLVAAVAVISFAAPNREGLFLFTDSRPNHRLADLLPLLSRCARMMATRALTLRLLAVLEASNLELNVQMQATQKSGNLGVLAGDIAHDFDNLLTTILGHTGLVRKELTDDSPARQHCAAIEQAAREAADLCRQMMSHNEEEIDHSHNSPPTPRS